jgi:ABC-type transport system involved in multi-copper enzyme maturation permease subunit
VAKVCTLCAAHLKLAARSILVLVAILVVLVAMVLVSLPAQVFNADDIPKVSLALVYGDGQRNDMLTRNISQELETIDMIDRVEMSTVDEAARLLETGEVDVVVEVPENTLDVLIYGGHACIVVRADDPLIGGIVYSITDNVAESLETLQNYSLFFSKASESSYPSAEAHNNALSAFNMKLIGAALGRVNSIESPWSAPPLIVHTLTLLLFLMVSIASFFVAVAMAKHYASGYVRYLYVRGVRYRHLLLSELLCALCITLVLSLVLGLILYFLNMGTSPLRFVCAALVLSVVLTMLYACLSGFRAQRHAATTRTLLGCLALMFFMLFAGGGFYPTEFMQSDANLINPAWLSHQLSLWALGGPLDALYVGMCVIPCVAAGLVAYLEWRRSV